MEIHLPERVKRARQRVTGELDRLRRDVEERIAFAERSRRTRRDRPSMGGLGQYRRETRATPKARAMRRAFKGIVPIVITASHRGVGPNLKALDEERRMHPQIANNPNARRKRNGRRRDIKRQYTPPAGTAHRALANANRRAREGKTR